MLALLDQLQRLKIRLEFSEGKLYLDAPHGVITEDIRSSVRQHKDALVGYMKSLKGGKEFKPIGKRPFVEGEAPPLSYAQRRLWFLDQFEPGSPLYNIPGAFRLVGKLDKAALARSLNEIVERHEALRTVFAVRDGEPVQIIVPHRELVLAETDLSGLSASQREERAQWLLQDETRRPFDLAKGPLIRTQLITLGLQEHLLMLTMHHIVSDGWSIGVLLNELSALYAALAQGRDFPLPALPIQYADYAYWQRQWLSGEVLQKQLTYWQTQLQGAPTLLSLPTDRPRPAVQTHRGAMIEFDMPERLYAALQALSRQVHGTLFMTLTAAFNILLSRYSGQKDICIGTPIANRNRAEIEALIGFFVNTLVLRTQIDPQASFETLLSQVKEMTLGAYAHQDVQFEQLVEALNPERHTSHSPLFQVMLVLQNVPQGASQMSGVTLSPMPPDNVTAKFDLTLTIFETAERFFGTFEYNTDLFDRETIERMVGHFTRLLEAIVQGPGSRIAELPMLGEAERLQLLEGWNATEQAYGKERRIDELFEEQAKRTPEAVAVMFEGREVTYRELNERANRLAHYLIEQGVGPDVLVGVCMDRSPEMIVALYGVLKAGGAYIPLDPAYPADRLRYMVEDARPRLLLTQNHLAGEWANAGVRTFCLDSQWEETAEYPPVSPGRMTGPGNLAYVIYTSGSTGRPKGVGVLHGSLTNFIHTMANEPGMHREDTLLSVTSLSFDIAALEIFLPLANGAKVMLVSRETAANPQQLSELIRTRNVTMMQATPSTWRMLVEYGWPVQDRPLKVLCGGEALPVDLAQRMLKHIPAIWNMYGPTETTIWSALRRVAQDDAISIGRPIANTQIYLLDEHLNPVPVGIAGELYIAGDGLARGYLNRPELTAERFIPNPFGKAPGARMYKTGDLAKYLPDGNIEYLGRNDFQVKVRGFRIELGEIEARLTACEGVREAVVVAREDSAGDQRLVAYVVGRQGQAPGVSELRDSLAKSLPDYMVPSHFVMLEKMPLTSNGKVDRKALPAPDMVQSEAEYVAPRNETEAKLVSIWAEVLKRDRISIHDNFFELGGHSLLATTVMVKICARLGKEVPLRILFEAPTIELLAKKLDAAEEGRKVLNDGAASESLDEGNWTPVDENLSKLRSRSPSSRNVFLIPGAGGSTEIFHGIARRLAAKGIDVFVLHYDGVDNENEPLGGILSIAEKYAAQVVRHCYGETVIAGYCIGGMVAYELGKALRKKGASCLKVAFIDTGVPEKNQQALPFDSQMFKSEFFKAICDTYSRTGEKIAARIFDGLSEDECIDYALSRMELKSRLETDSWKSILWRRYQVERAHILAIREYWKNTLAKLVNEGPHPERVDFSLKLIETAAMRDNRAMNTLVEMGVTETIVETVAGDHLTLMKRYHDQVANALLSYFDRPLQANADDLYESALLPVR